MLKNVNKSGRQRDFEPTTSGFPAEVTPDTCIMQYTNDSADTKSARHGQFQEKEKKLLLLN